MLPPSINPAQNEKIYGKYVKKQKKYMAHDPQNKCNLGDKVTIIESRPLSKRKRWHIIEVIESSSN